MIFNLIIYLIFFIVAEILNDIAYKKSTNNWNMMLRSPYHIIATIIAYGSAGWGFSILPELFARTLSANASGAKWIAAVFTISATLLFLYAERKYYKNRIKNTHR